MPFPGEAPRAKCSDCRQGCCSVKRETSSSATDRGLGARSFEARSALPSECRQRWLHSAGGLVRARLAKQRSPLRKPHLRYSHSLRGSAYQLGARRYWFVAGSSAAVTRAILFNSLWKRRIEVLLRRSISSLSLITEAFKQQESQRDKPQHLRTYAA